MFNVYFYGSEEEFESVSNSMQRYFKGGYRPLQNGNGYLIQLDEKKPNEFLKDLPLETREKLFNMLAREFSQKQNSSGKTGRKRINLPSRDVLQKERENLSVAKLAEKYGCSSTTINRRLGLIKNKKG